MKPKCPICGSSDYKHEEYHDDIWGAWYLVEEHTYCDRCGYRVEMAYSEPMEGFQPDTRRGYRDYLGNYHPKNTRKRARIRRKYHIKKPDNGWYFNMF